MILRWERAFLRIGIGVEISIHSGSTTAVGKEKTYLGHDFPVSVSQFRLRAWIIAPDIEVASFRPALLQDFLSVESFLPAACKAVITSIQAFLKSLSLPHELQIRVWAAELACRNVVLQKSISAFLLCERWFSKFPNQTRSLTRLMWLDPSVFWKVWVFHTTFTFYESLRSR